MRSCGSISTLLSLASARITLCVPDHKFSVKVREKRRRQRYLANAVTLSALEGADTDSPAVEVERVGRDRENFGDPRAAASKRQANEPEFREKTLS